MPRDHTCHKKAEEEILWRQTVPMGSLGLPEFGQGKCLGCLGADNVGKQRFQGTN